MKNIILITEDGEQLIASTDDGTNQLIINDTVIPSGDWVGTGTYTATIHGYNISIAKSPDLNGIIQIIRLSPYNYALKKAKQPWQPEQTTVTVDVGSTTTGAAGTDAVVTNSGDDVNVILDFVIPRGNKGDDGVDGASAGFGTPTASVDDNTGTPSVTVTATGSDTAKVFDFAFHNLKGEKGDKGDSPIIDSGRDTTLGTVNSNSYKDVSISFNKTFQTAPNVVACFESTAGSYGFGRLSLGVHSVTTTGFKVRVFNADTGSRSPNIYWIATV